MKRTERLLQRLDVSQRVRTQEIAPRLLQRLGVAQQCLEAVEVRVARLEQRVVEVGDQPVQRRRVGLEMAAETSGEGLVVQRVEARGRVPAEGVQALVGQRVLQHQEGVVGTGEVLVQDLVGHPDAVALLEPAHRVVVDLDAADADGADHQHRRGQRDNGPGPAEGDAPAGAQQARDGVVALAAHRQHVQPRQPVRLHAYDVGRHQGDGDDERQQNAEGDAVRVVAERAHGEGDGADQAAEQDLPPMGGGMGDRIGDG